MIKLECCVLRLWLLLTLPGAYHLCQTGSSESEKNTETIERVRTRVVVAVVVVRELLFLVTSVI